MGRDQLVLITGRAAAPGRKRTRRTQSLEKVRTGRNPRKSSAEGTSERVATPQAFLVMVSEDGRDLPDVLRRTLFTLLSSVSLIGTEGSSKPTAEILHPSSGQHAMSAPPALTRRQMDVLEAMAEGVTEREIARRLRISERTVQIHVANLCRALGVRSHFQMGVRAARLCLL